MINMVFDSSFGGFVNLLVCFSVLCLSIPAPTTPHCLVEFKSRFKSRVNVALKKIKNNTMSLYNYDSAVQLTTVGMNALPLTNCLTLGSCNSAFSSSNKGKNSAFLVNVLH